MFSIYVTTRLVKEGVLWEIDFDDKLKTNSSSRAESSMALGSDPRQSFARVPRSSAKK